MSARVDPTGSGRRCRLGRGPPATHRRGHPARLCERDRVITRGCAGPTCRLGWQARLELEIALRHGRSRVVGKHQIGPLTIQRPFHPEGAPCHLYLLHPPGGVVGGDELEVEIRVGSGAHALVTSPGRRNFIEAPAPRVGRDSVCRVRGRCARMVSARKHPLSRRLCALAHAHRACRAMRASSVGRSNVSGARRSPNDSAKDAPRSR
jgi:hypothetical protein